jgi:hypothetical protein
MGSLLPARCLLVHFSKNLKILKKNIKRYELNGIKRGKVCVLPCYSYNKAKEDLQLALNGRKMHLEIEKAVDLGEGDPVQHSRRQS